MDRRQFPARRLVAPRRRVAGRRPGAGRPVAGPHRLHPDHRHRAGLRRAWRGLAEGGRDRRELHRVRIRPQHDPGLRLGHDRFLCRRHRAAGGGTLARRRCPGRGGHRHRRERLRRRARPGEVLHAGHARLPPPSRPTGPPPASRRGWRRSRPDRCPTPRCNTGSGRSPRPTRPMSRSCRWASTRPSRRCWRPRSKARSCASRR